jgi:hypothetical protein
MYSFYIKPNKYLLSVSPIRGYYHTYYRGYKNVGNPDYLNILKNTYNSYPESVLKLATKELEAVLLEDLPQIPKLIGIDLLVVCVIPRAKAENIYYPTQLLFRSTVQKVIQNFPNYFIDGTNYIIRHTNTRTTHLPRKIPDYNNDGSDPYPGITKDTCYISSKVLNKDILLIDDIYTPGVNIAEDAINALLKKGAKSITFYCVGYTI